MSIEKITIPGPTGNLEAVLEQPLKSETKLLGIICHPHPLYDGSMDNKVVTTIVRVFQRLNIVPLRFNFRGVGQSQGRHDFGVGELADLRAVIDFATSHFPGYKLILAGFSFGSYIATKVATEVQPLALITIAPAVHHNDFASLPAITFPWIVVQGEQDEIVPPELVFKWLNSLASKPFLISMPNTSHFFHGQLLVLRDLLIERLQRVLKEAS